MTLDLVFGLDAKGFFVCTDSPEDEIALSDLRIDGTVQATGRMGILEVKLDSASLSTAADMRLTVDIIEPGPDPYSGVRDNKLRFSDLPQLLGAFELDLQVDPVNDDLVLTNGVTTPMGFKESALGCSKS